MKEVGEKRSCMFERTLEDLEGDATRKKGKLDRWDVDTIYLKREINPEEAVAIERALSSAGVTIEESAEDAWETPPNESASALSPTALGYLMRVSQKNPLLTRDEEIKCGDAIRQATSPHPNIKGALAERIRKRGERAREKLITCNMRLVVKVAFDRRFKGRVDADDLVQIGLIGLMKATEKFDPSWGTRFSTYATWWVQKAISQGCADQSTTVRIPVDMRQSISIYRRTARMLEKENGRQILINAIAEKLAWTRDYTAKIATFAEQRSVSLDAPIGKEEKITLKDTISDSLPNPEERAIERDTARWVRALLNNLEDDRLIDIVRRRFGFLGKDETLQEIGDDYGVTRERIRQLENKAIRKLKFRATKAHLPTPGQGTITK